MLDTCLIAILLLLPLNKILSQSQSKYHWNTVQIKTYSDLKSIKMFSPESGIAIGKNLLLFNNGIWAEPENQLPIDIDLIYVIDTNCLFACSKTIYQESDLYYFDGKKWSNINHPLANNIYSLNFKNKNNGIIGGFGEIAFLKNKKWEFIDFPHLISITNIQVIGDSTFWALTNDKGLFKYDKKWKQIDNSVYIDLIQLYNDNLYFIGKENFGIIHKDSISIISTDTRLKNIRSFSIVNDKNIYAVGNNGLILNYNGQIWQQQNSGTEENLNSISMLDNTDGWIVGNNGTILHYTDKIEIHGKKPWKGFDQITFNTYSRIINDEYGVAIFDFDEDGFPDIFTCGLYESNHLYIKKINFNYNDEAEKRGISGKNTNSKNKLNLGVCIGDIDNDNDMDIYVSSLNSKNTIYKNTGKGYFIDYSAISNGVGKKNERTNACIMGDVDNDGDLDIFIANENSTNRLFLNNGVGIYKDVTLETGLLSQGGGMGCSFGDIDNDGDLDIYVTNWAHSNVLYQNQWKEKGKLKFIDISKKAGVSGKSYAKSNGVCFSDINNDGYLDLFITNRKMPNRLYINQGNGIFQDKTAEKIGLDSLKSYGVVISDFDANGFKDIYVSNVGKNVFYENNGEIFFKKSIEFNCDLGGYSTGSAFADLDKDGDNDIYIANYLGESSSILKNKAVKNNFIKIRIKGIINNTFGIGSKIYIYEKLKDSLNLLFFDEIRLGSGYASANDPIKTVNLANNRNVDVKIVFPNGLIKILTNVTPGSQLTISDLSGIKKYYFLFSRWISKQIFDPHRLWSLIKIILVLLLIVFSCFYGLKRYKLRKSFIVINAFLLLAFYYYQYHYFEFDNWFLSSVVPLSSTILILLLLYYYFERSRVKRLALVEQNMIKEKLSRDLHDDLATTISSVGIYLTLIRYNVGGANKKLNELIGKSESLIQTAAESITDLIWAINPKSVKLSNLILKINSNFGEIFRDKGILYKTISKIKGDKITLNSKIKQNVYLIIKEALNNTLKYAKAENVSLIFETKGNKIMIMIIDDGTGFDLQNVINKGNGLINMKNRAKELNGKLDIETNPGHGTRIILEFEL